MKPDAFGRCQAARVLHRYRFCAVGAIQQTPEVNFLDHVKIREIPCKANAEHLCTILCRVNGYSETDGYSLLRVAGPETWVKKRETPYTMEHAPSNP